MSVHEPLAWPSTGNRTIRPLTTTWLGTPTPDSHDQAWLQACIPDQVAQEGSHLAQGHAGTHGQVQIHRPMRHQAGSEIGDAQPRRRRPHVDADQIAPDFVEAERSAVGDPQRWGPPETRHSPAGRACPAGIRGSLVPGAWRAEDPCESLHSISRMRASRAPGLSLRIRRPCIPYPADICTPLGPGCSTRLGVSGRRARFNCRPSAEDSPYELQRPAVRHASH